MNSLNLETIVLFMIGVQCSIVVLNLGSTDPRSLSIEFRKSVNLDGKNSFSPIFLTENLHFFKLLMQATNHKFIIAVTL